ncbi:short-chain dehydrogenase/reductase SDR [Hyphomicrobium denitrificans 1NES1]|uniref:Short-chain dehydrogenase/reductase SDR n=1 Tax=Hyphomicrobium denitrificans 1NES1 TaxID=670307 RepID=N0BA55_9HYPH|nr:SDR family oxidoreductase [Hyphomicrobium denitrificans]AGK59893.1 short-chain dehydrogenase/reductase SDR [Hyphomicrobium denitrificans 1NES1]
MPYEPAVWLSRLMPWRAPVDPNAIHAARAAVADLKPAVVVTGGSRGIGLALAKCFIEAGCTTVIVARNALKLADAVAELKAATGVEPVSILCDITEPNAADVISAGLANANLYLDVLVNNAGMGLAGPFLEQTPKDLSSLLAVNIESLTRLTRAALPDMIARRQGGILNVASLGAYIPGPNQAAYYASKSYILSLTEAIASEVAGQGVRVSALTPGPVDTEFHRDMGAERSLYRIILPSLTPDRVAKSAYRGFMFGQRVIVPGIFNTAFVVALKVLPHIVTVPMMRGLLRREFFRR